jgi:hypothetical protein
MRLPFPDASLWSDDTRSSSLLMVPDTKLHRRGNADDDADPGENKPMARHQGGQDPSSSIRLIPRDT